MTRPTDCTGPRYRQEAASLAMIPGWHGKYGHLNVLQRDHDSMETAFGQHDRVIAFEPQGNRAYCRIDHVWQRGTPTEKQIIAVMKAWPNSIKGRWKLESMAQHDDGSSTDVYLTR